MTENPPAFPRDERYLGHNGMDLRDYFAGQVLGGAAASPDSALNIPADARQHEIDAALAEHWSCVARAAYIAADAMLSARQETRHGA